MDRRRPRVHLLGKGVLRFHAVYWPAILASAGLPLPTDILVHDYLTVEGRKISKSGRHAIDPVELAREYGTDALRWWLLREVPRIGDVDFTRERLVARANDELANGIGNLVNRVVAMVWKYRDGRVPAPPDGPDSSSPGSRELADAIRRAPAGIDAALSGGDFRTATSAVWSIAVAANRYVSQARPWQLASAARDGDEQAGLQLDAILALLANACQELARQLEPFLPDAAARIASAGHSGWRPAAAARSPSSPGSEPYVRFATSRTRAFRRAGRECRYDRPARRCGDHARRIGRRGVRHAVRRIRHGAVVPAFHPGPAGLRPPSRRG